MISMTEDIQTLQSIVSEMNEPGAALTEVVGRLGARRVGVREVAVRLKEAVEKTPEEDGDGEADGNVPASAAPPTAHQVPEDIPELDARLPDLVLRHPYRAGSPQAE
jgi:hypothetical protein